jgi:signal transduction histidine kinase
VTGTPEPSRLAGLSALPAVVLEVTADGRIADSNGRLEQKLGEAIIGRHFPDLLDASSRTKWRRMLGRTRERGEPKRWEFVIVAGAAPTVHAFSPVWHESGSRFWLLDADLGSADEALYDALAEANSELVNTQRELTKEKVRLDRALRREEEARAAADAAVRVRDDVLAIVSHDLRTPIGAIQVAVSSLLDFGEQFAPEVRTRQLEVIRRAGTRALRLIEDLLAIARIEAGQLPIEPARIDLSALLDDVCKLHRSRSADRAVRVECSAAGAPTHLVADPHRLHQALSNLIDNAVRYSPEGGIVEVVATETADGVRLEVRDRGPGIPADEIGQLFERFWQARRAGRGGAGLGLAIVRGIAEAHGGTVHVESEPGLGSRFSLVLPKTQEVSDEVAPGRVPAGAP